MADNVPITPGTGAFVAADEIGGIKHQRVKVQYGDDGSATDVSASNPLPVTVGTVTVTGPLTDAQLRNTPVPVSGPLTDAQLRATALPVSGTVTATGPLTDTQLRATAVPVSGPLTDTQLRATAVPVSGTVTATGPLTDTQLRATAVPVSGTVTATGPLTDTQLRATAVPVSGPLTEAQLTTAALATSAKQDSAAALVGAVTETAPASDTASSGLNGRLQRLSQHMTSMQAQLPATLGTKTAANALAVVVPDDVTIVGPTGTLAIATDLITGNGTGAANSWTDVSAYQSAAIQIVMDASSATGALTFEQTNDTSLALAGQALPYYIASQSQPVILVSTITNAASTTVVYLVSLSCKYLRIRSTIGFTAGNQTAIVNLSRRPLALTPTQLAFNGVAAFTGGVNGLLGIGGATAHSSAATGNPVRVSGRVAPATPDLTLAAGDASDVMISSGQQLINKPFAPATYDWHYAAAGSGIVNTNTAVTVKASAGASLRNYITSIDMSSEALGTATEFAIRDGAGGTVLWRTKLPTTGFPPFTVYFPSPLFGTAATLLEIITLTASGTGAVYANLHGYIGV